MDKPFYHSKTVWGIIIASVFTFVKTKDPSLFADIAQVLGGALAAYGIRDAL